MTETLEHTARKIAERGRDALVARLRPAFEQAAATHGEGLNLDDEQLERMVQRAADRADGLQWRRALAQVATEQLGIGLGEALSHPAVARAQAIVGAPSYEDALGEIGAPSGGESTPATPGEEAASEETAGDASAEPEVADEAVDEKDAEADDADDGEEEAGEEDGDNDDESDESDEEEGDEEDGDEEDSPPDATAEHAPTSAPPTPAAAPATAAATTAPAAAAEPTPSGPPGDPAALRLRAVHLGGIANLAPAEGDLELHLSEAGLDIMRGPERTPLGRLTWDEIVALEAPAVGGRFRRRKPVDAHLVIRSAQGSASFEVPGVTTEELEEHLAPMLARHQK